jgi:hypothetical protein
VSESAFIESMTNFLSSAQLTPSPQVGVAEPADSGALPAIVLSLEVTGAVHPGLGARTSLMTGALPVTVVIDLANPVLAAPPPPPLNLLDSSRTHLTLPHGGQVRADGSEGALAATDISISVDGAARPLVAATPVGDQITLDPAVGAATFGSPLPGAGKLQARYFLGQWERRLSHIGGTLRVDVCGATADEAQGLSNQILTALGGARGVVTGLNVLAPSSVGSVGAPDLAPPNARRRTLRFTFDFESQIDRPDSSGGIIRDIPLRGPTPPPQPDDTQFLT